MESAATSRTPSHLWMIGGASLLWNAFGAYDYLMKQTGNAGYLAQLPPEMTAYLESYPVWMEAAWGLGVWGAVLGSVLLLLRNRLAILAFAMSLVGLLVATFYQYSLSDAPPALETSGMLMMTLMIWAVAIFLYGYSRGMREKGVLR